MNKRLLWWLLLPPGLLLALRLLARVRLHPLDIAIVALAGLLAWAVVTRRKGSAARRERITREERLESIRRQLHGLESRIETVTNYLVELRTVRAETAAELDAEQRPTMRDVLGENLSRYDATERAQSRYLEAMIRLRDLVREKYDMYRERLRAAHVTGRSPKVEDLDGSTIIEDTTALDGEIADLDARMQTLADRIEATVEIEELVERFGRR
jgi:chromosome segregation ATPase